MLLILCIYSEKGETILAAVHSQYHECKVCLLCVLLFVSEVFVLFTVA